MGLILRAVCGACDLRHEDLRLGGSHDQIAAHDVSHYELFSVTCCQSVQSVRTLLGQPYVQVECVCGVSWTPSIERRYRVTTLTGEVFSGHDCPSCGEAQLVFAPTGEFI